MTANETTAFDVTATYVHLPDGGAAIAVDHTPEFWSELASGARRYDGRMMTAHRVSSDMRHWEIHPAGEELLVAVDASVTAVFQRKHGEETIDLAPGMACIVPRGTWHRIRVVQPGVLIFLTHGEGTEHKPL